MASDTVYAATLVVFIAVYALIAVRKIRGHDVPSWIPALAGGGAVLLVGAVTPQTAWDFVRWDAIELLLGMMLMTASLDYCGFFTIVADFLGKRFPERKTLLFAITTITSFLCMIMLNDAVVLIFTPIAIMSCRRLKADPVPYVIGIFTGANIGCAATFVGAPHCALAGSFGGVSFIQYALIAIPITIVCTIIASFMLKHHFSADLDKDFQFNNVEEEEIRTVSKNRMYACLSILAVMLILFTFNDQLGFGLGHISLVGGIIAMIVTSTSGSDAPKYIAKHVNWGILAFFFGLFILIAGVAEVGIIDSIATACGMDSKLPSIGTLALFTAVLSNLISNVPAVMLIGHIIQSNGAGTLLWAGLALISSFGANLTTIGSAANLIGIAEAEKRGFHVNFFRHLKVGVPITLVTCSVAVLYLYGLQCLGF